jgi:hypothetical protein
MSAATRFRVSAGSIVGKGSKIYLERAVYRERETEKASSHPRLQGLIFDRTARLRRGSGGGSPAPERPRAKVGSYLINGGFCVITKCRVCGKSVEESKFWTVCPHNPIDEAPDAEFCKVHKQFDCFTCDEYLIRK